MFEMPAQTIYAGISNYGESICECRCAKVVQDIPCVLCDKWEGKQ